MWPSPIQIALASFAGLILLAIALSLGQPTVNPGRFEFDVTQPFEGIFHSKPVPSLWVARRQESPELANYSMYPLVSVGRYGLSKNSQVYDGIPILIEGKLLYNGTLTVIEVDESRIRQAPKVFEYPEIREPQDYGEVTLRGEVIDLKSYAGYQEPGWGSLLISPASNALRGGVPPVMVVRHRDGPEYPVLLLDGAGNSLGMEALGWLGIHVELQGKLQSTGGVLTLQVKPESRRRLLPWEGAF